MKIPSVILSVYILLLSAIPCHCYGEGAPCGNDEGQITVVTQNVENHADADTCTPFCACANCHSANLFSEQFSVTFPVYFPTSITSFYQANGGFSIPLNFWRPPQA